MCFYNDDYDWIAEVHSDFYERAETVAKCYDCGREIGIGEWHHRIEQLENECCQICEDPDSDWYEDPEEIDEEEGLYGPGEHPHYYGQSWQGAICRRCALIRAAIYDLEEKEGCPEYARQPAYGELRDVMANDQERWGNRKYTNHAIEMFPELATSVIV